MLVCRWFLGCYNAAIGTIAHPTLGDVPVCARCAKIAGVETARDE